MNRDPEAQSYSFGINQRALPIILVKKIRIRETDILKEEFFARSKLYFKNFAQEEVEKYHKKSFNICEK